MSRSQLRNSHRLVVKIGSSLLSGRDQPIPQLVDELAALHADGHELVLVTSGAIHFGMEALDRDERPVTLPEKQAIAATGQHHLMSYYDELFTEHGVQTGQVLLTQQDVDNRESYLNASNTLNSLLRERVVPIINENDTVATEEIKFGNNDTLSAMVATLVDADAVILLTDVDGLYPTDPETEDEPLEVVEEITSDIHEIAGPSDEEGSSVGGMETKVQAAETVTQSGTPLVVASGFRDSVLKDLLAGEPIGTLFVAKNDEEAVHGRKRWIGYHLLPKGYVEVDPGAAQAIINRGTSLLPSGVTDAVGQFERGDAIKVINRDGEEFARGIANYNPQEVNQIKGCQTDEIFDILGYRDFDEIIHRDNMVVYNDD